MTRLDKAKLQAKFLQGAFFFKAAEIFGEEATPEALAAMHIALMQAVQLVERQVLIEWPSVEECAAWLDAEVEQ